MKLEDQSYQIFDRGKIEVVSHNDLLGFNKQIIRLRENLFENVESILGFGKEISLYNHYNPINSDLMRKYRENKSENDLAIIAKIVGTNNLGPILDGDKLKQVIVLDMKNIFFEDIESKDLEKSIAFLEGKDVNVANLIKWLSDDFYSCRLTVEEIQSYQRLFYRKIKSN